MSEAYLGDIRMFGGNFAPVGWEFCKGQLLSISDYDVLYSLIGTTYGGDGQSTFGLPNLSSRTPVHMGTAPGASTYAMGQTGGAETVTLTTAQMPAHVHVAGASSTTGTRTSPSGAVWAGNEAGEYVSSAPNVSMSASAVSVAGGSFPHANMPPYLAINFIICTNGVYPSRA